MVEELNVYFVPQKMNIYNVQCVTVGSGRVADGRGSCGKRVLYITNIHAHVTGGIAKVQYGLCDSYL